MSRREFHEQYYLMSEVKVSTKKFAEMCRYNGLFEKMSNGIRYYAGIRLRVEEPVEENLFN